MIFIDIETTGTKEADEILSIAIVDDAGKILMNQYIKPVVKKTWPDAEKTHGITPDFIFSGNYSTAYEVRAEVIKCLTNQTAVFYNADFDRPFIERMFDTGTYLFDSLCCMNRFAEYVGEPSTKPYHVTGFKTHKLIIAAERTGFVWANPAHNALGDAFACLHVWKWLDEYYAAKALQIAKV